jgi:hypothetical protein
VSILNWSQAESEEWSDLALSSSDVAPREEVGIYGFCFRDFGRLREFVARLGAVSPMNLLCVFNPVQPPVVPVSQPSVTLLGYDLKDDQTSISALTNCGGFPAAFSYAEL